MAVSANVQWSLTSPLKAISAQKYRILAFCLLWITYGSTYLIRKPLGVIKSDLSSDLNLSKFELGMLDTALLLPYAVMQVFLGPLADHLGPRKTLFLCLITAASSMALFGICDSFYLCLLLLFICGTALAPTWPSCSKGLASWFHDSNSRDTIFGIFATSGLVGGVCGTALAVWFQNVYGWRLVHLIPSSFLLVLALVVVTFIRSPKELGIPDNSVRVVDIETIDSPALMGKQSVQPQKKNRFRSWLSLWLIPLIPEVTVAVFTLKVIRYCMYMWLPLYLLDYLNYNKTEAGLMSTAFEIGGGLGSAAIGLLVDRLFAGRSLWTLFASVVLSSLSLLSFILTAHWGAAVNVTFLLLAGATNCGPDSLLSGSIPARLGERNGLGAGAALTGLVNGAGSLGTVIEGPIIGLVAGHYGWIGVFLLMVTLSAIGALALLRAIIIRSRKNPTKDEF